MEDKEIVKALECCIDMECTKCPLNYDDCEERDFESLVKRAIPIFNHLQAENERLTNSVTTLTKSISELTDEVERQKKARDESFQFAANIVEAEKIVVAETKAEAYKEFADRLKEQKYQSSDWSHGEHPFVVEESDIDDTLYDLVGEDNESTNNQQPT